MLGLIGAGLGVASSIASAIGASKDNKEAKKIKPEYKPYEVSPYAKQGLGLAKARLGSKSAAVQQAQADIQNNQAQAAYGMEKAASDGSQLLSGLAGVQAQADESAAGLAGMQEQFNQQNLANLNQANAAMTNELDKVYQDNMQKYMTDLNLKMAYRNSARQGWGNAIGGMMSVFGGAANGAFGEDVQNLFSMAGGGKKGQGSPFGMIKADGVTAGDITKSTTLGYTPMGLQKPK